MSDSPLVSVVLPTHNRAALLSRALTSVLDQTYRNLEVIVVDDGSTDHTEQVVRQFTDPRVRYLQRRQGGAGAARNTGIAAAKGEWIAFQDSDDAWLPEKLARQVSRALECGPDVGVILCAHVDLWPDGRRAIRGQRERAMFDDMRDSLLFGLWYITPTWLVRKSLLVDTGGFDEPLRSSEDYDLAFRLADKTRFDCVPDILVEKHNNAGSVFNHPFTRVDGFRRVLERHRWRWRNHPYWLARHEAMLGVWYFRDCKLRYRGLHYLAKAYWHQCAAAWRHTWDVLPFRLKLWLLPFEPAHSKYEPVWAVGTGSKRPVARLFTPAPLDRSIANGFSPRWHAFAKALQGRFDLEVVVLRGAWYGQEVPLERFVEDDIDARAVHEIFAAHHLPAPTRYLAPFLKVLHLIASRSAGPILVGAPDVLEPRPAIAVFFTHLSAHLAFSMPDTPSLFVLEEALGRTEYLYLRAPTRRIALTMAWRHALQWLAERRYRRFVRRCAARGPIVAINREEGDWFKKYAPEASITVLPHGLQIGDYRPTSAAPDHDIAILGDLSQSRNYVPTRRLIRRALERTDTRSLRWLLVGRDPDESLRSLPSDRVSIEGSVPDVQPYYARARVIAVPAQLATGSKTSVIKGWAMQRPVVTTPVAARGLPARPGDNLLIAADDDALLDEILRLLRDSALADRLATAGRRTALEECDQSRQVERFAALCDTLIDTDAAKTAAQAQGQQNGRS